MRILVVEDDPKIADRVRGIDFDTGTNVIDVHVTYLRKELGGTASGPFRTVRGVGYVLESPVGAAPHA